MKLATIRTRLGKATPTANRNFLKGNFPLTSIMVQPKNKIISIKKVPKMVILVNFGQFLVFLVKLVFKFSQVWSIFVSYGMYNQKMFYTNNLKSKRSQMVNFGRLWLVLVIVGQF